MADSPPPRFEHRGSEYTRVLARLHAALKPKTYFEIGTQTGQSLALAQCASLAVDPKFMIDREVIGAKPQCSFFQGTSDSFFRDTTPDRFLGGPIDLAFLDGMHWYEYLLRDFYHTEAFCRPNSVIVLHDCLPPDPYVGRRLIEDDRLASQSAFPGWWAGDVWKTVLILRRHRPDLRIICVDAPPTGLVLITDLDPQRGPWQWDYSEQVASVLDLDLETFGINRLVEELDLQSTSLLDSDERMSTIFWL